MSASRRLRAFPYHGDRERAARILAMRDAGQTLREVAVHLGIGHERVRQLEGRARSDAKFQRRAAERARVYAPVEELRATRPIQHTDLGSMALFYHLVAFRDGLAAMRAR